MCGRVTRSTTSSCGSRSCNGRGPASSRLRAVTADLRVRVRSYLTPGGDGRYQLRFLERDARDVEFIAPAGTSTGSHDGDDGGKDDDRAVPGVVLEQQPAVTCVRGYNHLAEARLVLFAQDVRRGGDAEDEELRRHPHGQAATRRARRVDREP